MTNPGSLSTLIKSLSSAEKGYFRKFLSVYPFTTDPAIKRLFDTIDPDYYHNAIISGKPPERQPQERNMLLYRLILKSLYSYSTENFPGLKLLSLLLEVELLYDKRLTRQCTKMLLRAKKIAYQYEAYELLVEIVRREEILLFMDFSEKNAVFKNEMLIQEKHSLFEKLMNISHYRSLYFEVAVQLRNQGILRSQDKIAHAHSFLNHPLIRSEKMALSSEARFFHLLIRASISQNADADFHQSGKYMENVIKYLSAPYAKMKSGWQLYTTAYYLYISNLSYIHDFRKGLSQLNVFKKITSESAEEKAMLFMQTTILELDLCFSCGKFKEGLSLVPGIEKALKQYREKEMRRYRELIYLNIGALYWGAQDFSQALEWLNRVISPKNRLSGERTHAYAILLILFVHYQLGNFEKLQTLVKKAACFLKKADGFFLTEQRIINFFTEAARTKKRDQKMLRIFYKDLQQLRQDPIEGRFFITLDIEAWAESQAEGKPFEKVLNSRYPYPTQQ